jgi:hypothetical protein
MNPLLIHLFITSPKKSFFQKALPVKKKDHENRTEASEIKHPTSSQSPRTIFPFTQTYLSNALILFTLTNTPTISSAAQRHNPCLEKVKKHVLLPTDSAGEDNQYLTLKKYKFRKKITWNKENR